MKTHLVITRKGEVLEVKHAGDRTKDEYSADINTLRDTPPYQNRVWQSRVACIGSTRYVLVEVT